MSIILDKACPHCGCILQISSAELRFWQGVRKTDSCWLWTRKPSTNGYGRLHVGLRGKDVYVHRYSWELHYGPIPNGLWVLHRCDNPLCVRPDHLFLGTHEDNMADMTAKQRCGFQLHPESVPRGERHGVSRLVADDVRSIRQLRAEGMTVPAIARKFGVCKTTVKMIVARKTWAHIT